MTPRKVTSVCIIEYQCAAWVLRKIHRVQTIWVRVDEVDTESYNSSIHCK